MRYIHLAQQFESISRQFAEKPAIVFCDSTVCTYGDLNRKANRAARYLRGKGVQSGDVICLSSEKRLLTFVFMIAALKLGAPYCIIDPESPINRILGILETACPSVIVANTTLTMVLRSDVAESRCVLIDQDDEGLERSLAECNPENFAESRGVHGYTPAYIMYTSGSTGRPKGATVSHASVLNLVEWGRNTFDLSAEDRFTNVNPLYFDNSVFDFYSALFIGATLCPFTEEVVREPTTLVRQIDELKCTNWFSTPSLLIYLTALKVLNSDNLLSVRRFIFGGEGYPKSRLQRLYNLYSPRSQFYNVYGPTECTCICSAYRISDADFGDVTKPPLTGGLVPLGEIADNFSSLILDENRQPVPDDTSGELWLGGPQVALGYQNDSQSTQEAFLQNPLHSLYRDILYRTRDYVTRNSRDGLIYFSGRSDNQIKHMGYRVELEEIESALYQIECVEEAIVVHGEARGLSRLVAIVRVSSQSDESSILSNLARMLPSYMLPSEVQFMNGLPRNANGKLDRRALSRQCFS